MGFNLLASIGLGFLASDWRFGFGTLWVGAVVMLLVWLLVNFMANIMSYTINDRKFGWDWNAL